MREGETPNEILNAVRRLMTELRGHMDIDELNNSLQGHPDFEDVSGADILGVYTGSERATITFGKGDPTIKLAWVGKLSPQSTFGRGTWTATDYHKWPSLFQKFWDQYANVVSREHLKNAVYHYIEAQRIYGEGSIGQGLVAAQSTLQALTRWWNGMKPTDEFGRYGVDHYLDSLVKAVKKAKLGQDSGVAIDVKALAYTIQKAAGHRNDIDHGRGIKILGNERDVIYYQMHHLNLARLLILSKLGDHDRNARGFIAGPVFIEAQE